MIDWVEVGGYLEEELGGKVLEAAGPGRRLLLLMLGGLAWVSRVVGRCARG